MKRSTYGESMGIAELRHRRVGALSGGQQRLVEITRPIATKPPLILLDEWEVGLSPSARAAVRDLAGREGIGILLVEHAVEMVLDLSDWVVEKIAEGTSDEVRRDPVVEAYLGHC